MNKKINTIIFVIFSTIIDFIIIFIFLIIGIIIISLLSGHVSPIFQQILIIPLFLLSIFGTLFIHKFIIDFISKRIDINKYFSPIFGKSKNKTENYKNK